MTYKVNELSGALLDAAVAKAEGERAIVERAVIAITNADDTLDRVLVDEDRCHRLYRSYDGTERGGFWLHYSGKWDLGGPIIERERIGLHFEYDPCHPQVWHAITPAKTSRLIQASIGTGDTALIAAMRSYVARRFGDEVDL